MFDRHTPRPTHHDERYLAQVLADRDVDLTKVGACGAAFIDALGYVPECDWLSLRNRAADLRAEQATAASASVLRQAAVAIAVAGLAALAAPQAQASSLDALLFSPDWLVLRIVVIGIAVVGLVAAICLVIDIVSSRTGRATPDAWMDDGDEPVIIAKRDGGKR